MEEVTGPIPVGSTKHPLNTNSHCRPFRPPVPCIGCRIPAARKPPMTQNCVPAWV